MARIYRAQMQYYPAADESPGDYEDDSDDEEEDEVEDCGGWIEFEKVIEEERACLDQANANRSADGQRTAPFSLAFSGGGIRAAAFQAGVLWRLAKMNRLKDVEYFTAVSGGGYITSAFASHIAGADPPEPGKVKEWYTDIVAKTVCRMQRNAGDFVRDLHKKPGVPDDGSGLLPRWLDLPMLIVTLVVTLAATPVFLFISLVVPATIMVEHFFGEAMRESFCTIPANNSYWEYHKTMQQIFLGRTAATFFVPAIATTVLATVVAFLMQKLIPACNLKQSTEKARERWDGTGAPPRPDAGFAYCMGHAFTALLKRASILLMGLAVLLYAMTIMEIQVYKTTRKERCTRYVLSQLEQYRQDDQKMTCASYQYELYRNSSTPWWRDEAILDKIPNNTRPHKSDPFLTQLQENAKENANAVEKVFKFIVLPSILIGICCMPYFGSFFLTKAVAVLGPLFAAVFLISVFQYRVYGPVTRNEAGLIAWEEDRWTALTRSSILLTMLMAPFFEEIRCCFHFYYKRCLQLNFFHEGRDIPFQNLNNSDYCPFVILTGTSSDFQPPGDTDFISELSFSPLHCGSEETGYLKMPQYRSLAKCTALTGAGCLDAISLTMNETLEMRFWLEMLNLSWGDYIIFQENDKVLFPRNEYSGLINRFLHRLPAALLTLIVYGLIYTGWESCKAHQCGACEWQYRAALLLQAAMIGLSFFSFLPGVNTLLLSPLLRQVHQFTSYYYVGKHPPPMLYVTDGGVRDCTALVQLLWRRSQRILLVLAAADPRDELGVLKTAMAVARELKIATFYDPSDPRSDLSVLFDKYKEDRDAPYLHIGISYCWDGAHSDKPKSGHLFIVKNRLPNKLEGQPVRPLLTEEEMRGEPITEDWDSADEWEDMTTDQLGPFCCCDCCHQKCNAGPKFPHGTFTGYLYLTPQWCNSLARLAYEVSGPAIDEVSRAGVTNAWERHVK